MTSHHELASGCCPPPTKVRSAFMPHAFAKSWDTCVWKAGTAAFTCWSVRTVLSLMMETLIFAMTFLHCGIQLVSGFLPLWNSAIVVEAKVSEKIRKRIGSWSRRCVYEDVTASVKDLL